jgi:hypothetical protein
MVGGAALGAAACTVVASGLFYAHLTSSRAAIRWRHAFFLARAAFLCYHYYYFYYSFHHHH